MPGHAKDRRLEVFLVASQIDEGDHLGALLAHADPVQVAVLGLGERNGCYCLRECLSKTYGEIIMK